MDNYEELIRSIDMLYQHYQNINSEVFVTHQKFKLIKAKINSVLDNRGIFKEKFWG